jgi:microcystin-dependent protein|tara:strand:- start:426 stop:989 length:564 start_codon:yes stop_codon:yes gene_type:complete
MANYEATKYNFNGSDLTGIEGTATGTVLPWSSGSVPSGFLECNGAAVSRSTYSALFAVVSTTYGAGDGSSTFNLPNLADNIPMGKSGTKALASTGGANTVAASGTVGGSTANATLSVAQLASHSHEVQGQTQGTQNHATLSTYGGGQIITLATGSGQGHSHNMSATFSGTATSVLQPYLTLLYIIKT